MKTARLVLGYLRHNMMSAMAYRGAFIMQVVGMILNDVVILFFWWVLFTRIPVLGGWSMVQVMMLYALVAFAFGLGNIVCGNTIFVARAVVRGELDYYLALPADPLVHLLVSRMHLSAWGDLLFGLLVFLLVD
ncbi:MAG: ABC-2 family transporter protein, partial [Anaerolineae bacterium]|nr:ABC-2 family transporter protein [Anaerolineae bacterium]